MLVESMTKKQKFVITDYPNNGRLAKFEKELLILEKEQNIEGIQGFSKKLFDECTEYLKSTYNFRFPNLFLTFLTHKEFSELADKLDAMLGAIPRHRAITVFKAYSFPNIYIDLQSHFEDYRPIESIVSLCMDYIEELIHTSDQTKNETQIHDVVCLAIEGFLEIKLPDSLKQYRIEYAKTCDNTKLEK